MIIDGNTSSGVKCNTVTNYYLSCDYGSRTAVIIEIFAKKLATRIFLQQFIPLRGRRNPFLNFTNPRSHIPKHCQKKLLFNK